LFCGYIRRSLEVVTMQLKLVKYPDPRLLVRCLEYDSSIGESLKKRRMFRSEMFRVLERHGGVGLAAPQVGMNIRMFAWLDQGICQIIWNPVLESVSGQQQSREGCLSLPGVTVTMTRNTSSVLKGIGINNLPLRFIGDAHTTRIWQHEIDHLDGKLIIDNMTKEETGENKGTLRRLLKAFDG